MRTAIYLGGLLLGALLVTSGSAGAQPATVVEIAMGTPDERKMFAPDNLRLPVNTALRLVLVNRSDTDHTFHAPGLMEHAEVRLDENRSAAATLREGVVAVEPHGTAVLDVQVRQAGTYDFWCTMPGHAEEDMRGTISVIAPE